MNRAAHVAAHVVAREAVANGAGLADLGEFAAALLDPQAPPPPGLVAHNGADVALRFGVYRNNVVVSLTNALRDTFPVVAELVGDEFFAALAAAFVRQCPLRSPVMHELGAPFADWLMGFEPAAALPYLPGVARLEHMRILALHAADAEALEPAVLAGCLADPHALEGLALALHPSLQVAAFEHAAVSLWQAHQLGNEMLRDAALGAIDLACPEAALVLRDAGDEVLVVPLPGAAEAQLVAALQAGTPLGAAVAMHPTADLPGTLAALLRHGVVVGFHPGAPGAGT